MHTTLDQILAAGIDDGVAPGAVAIIVNREGVLWQGAAGERVLGNGVAMTVDTVGAIFSMTKAITGAAAMQLVERGALALDAPAGDICPELKNLQVLEGFDAVDRPILRPSTTSVTLRQLLTHTSGFTYEIWNANEAKWKESTGTKSLFTRENSALLTPLAFDPGTQWQYGIGIEWVGKMIEEVTGKSLGNYIAKYLTGPLGMEDTAFEPTASMLKRAAGIHARSTDGSLTPMQLPTPENPEFELGGGGLYGTMTDYARFIRMILNDGALDGARVLNAETVSSMCQNHIGDLRVQKMNTVVPAQSNDAEFFPGEPKSWGLTFQVSESDCHTGRPAGTLMWAGRANSFYWIDRKNDIGGAYMSQVLPFADEKSVELFYALEKAVYDSLT